MKELRAPPRRAAVPYIDCIHREPSMPTFVLAILEALFGGASTSSIDTSLQLGPRP